MSSFALHNQCPLESFLALKKDHPQAFYFEAHDLDGKLKLSIIGLDYFKRLRLVGLKTEVNGQFIEEDFFATLRQEIKKLHTDSKIPYRQGGAFGSIGYESVALMEKKLQQLKFFNQNIEKTVIAEIFLSQNLIVFEHEKGLIHFNLKTMAHGQEVLRPVKMKVLPATVTKVDLSGLKPSLGKETFLKSVAVLKEHIKAGNIFQAVLAERFEKKTRLAPLDLFIKAKSQCPSAYSFYFDFLDSSFFGFSPEVFLKASDGDLETHPIAGTMPRGANVAEDEKNRHFLEASIKEGAEHLMLVDLARNDLGRVSEAGSVQVEEFRKLLYLTNVMHLVSIVTGRMSKEADAISAFQSCFPAGTLSGAPKIRAMEILAGLEKEARGFYGGAVVAFDGNGNLDSCIAIRSLEVKEGKAILRAGAGIVQDSIPENEYREIEHKLKALIQVLNESESEHLEAVVSL